MNDKTKKLILSAVFLALCMVLPLLTGQIQTIGQALCPMHFPVLLCGFICGPAWGAAVGFIAPLLRFLIFGMPPVFPTGVAMAFELCAYGLLSGLMYRAFPKKPVYVYVTLILSMIGGRIVWGVVRLILAGITGGSFPWKAFISGAVLNSIPGIIAHIVLIPAVIFALKGAGVKELK
ncbi:MAG: ECF transporter S component [Clostridia bacterium]|nr:ECF transporter S component [Clostridia bacterium]